MIDNGLFSDVLREKLVSLEELKGKYLLLLEAQMWGFNLHAHRNTDHIHQTIVKEWWFLERSEHELASSKQLKEGYTLGCF